MAVFLETSNNFTKFAPKFGKFASSEHTDYRLMLHKVIMVIFYSNQFIWKD